MTKHINQQQFRLNAIEAELAALTSQEQALFQISIEHHCGIDIGCNVSVGHFTRRSRELVNSLKTMLEQFAGMNDETRTNSVKTFENSAAALKTEVQQLIPSRDAEAERHLSESLEEGGAKRKWVDMAIVPDTASELKVKAHMHCHAAETEQIRSFVLQTIALCDLCVETLCVAAEGAAE